MPETGRWHGHVFEVSPQAVRGFEALSLKASCETEEKETDGQKYVARKAANPLEGSLTVRLSAYLGSDVRTESDAFLADTQEGAQDYFYVGNRKLLPCRLMLVSAATEEIQIAPDGTWTSCDVKLTLKQSAKTDGKLSVMATGGRTKPSVKGNPIITYGTQISGLIGDAITQVSELFQGQSSLLDRAKTYIRQSTATVDAAKAASADTVAKPTVNLIQLLK